MCKTSYITSSGRKVLEYDPPDIIVLNLPFILTGSKKLTRNMPYMLLEGKPKAIRLLDFRDADGIVYLDVKELLSGSTYTMSWNMEFDTGYWIWSLADFETLTNLP